MKDLIKKQEEERMRLHIKCLAKAECAEDCDGSTVIRLGFVVNIIEEELLKARKETAEAVAEKMIGAEQTVKESEEGGTYFLIIDGYNNRIKEEKELKKQIIENL